MKTKPTGFNSAGEVTGLTQDEKITSLFQPDTLLSDHYFENFRRKTVWQPEKRLMVAILRDAIACYQDNLYARNGKKKKLFSEAEQWIAQTDGDWVFSFEAVCETLGLNPEYLRQGLLRWQDRKRRHFYQVQREEPAKLAG